MRKSSPSRFIFYVIFRVTAVVIIGYSHFNKLYPSHYDFGNIAFEPTLNHAETVISIFCIAREWQ